MINIRFEPCAHVNFLYIVRVLVIKKRRYMYTVTHIWTWFTGSSYQIKNNFPVHIFHLIATYYTKVSAYYNSQYSYLIQLKNWWGQILTVRKSVQYIERNVHVCEVKDIHKTENYAKKYNYSNTSSTSDPPQNNLRFFFNRNKFRTENEIV